MQNASAVAAVAAGANPVAMATSVGCEVGKSIVWGASRVKLLRPNGCGSARSACTITEGAKLPDASLSYFDKEGNVHSVKVSDLTRAKKVVLFAVPGAFTPTCSTQHLPGFIAKAEELRNAGVDVLACVSVNDAFVMRAWGEQQNVGDKVLLLSDGLCSFTKALGATVDLSDKPVGLGVRSRRYSMLVDDGVVKALNMEEGGAFTTSSAEEILKQLQKPKAAPNVECSAGHNVLRRSIVILPHGGMVVPVNPRELNDSFIKPEVMVMCTGEGSLQAHNLGEDYHTSSIDRREIYAFKQSAHQSKYQLPMGDRPCDQT